MEISTDDASLGQVLESFFHAAPSTAAPATHRYRLERAGGGFRVALAHGKPPYGPTSVGEAFAFLEWRATDDLLHESSPDAFLHAAGARFPAGMALLIGASGSGKSTLCARLLADGHRVWGDDLVRFAPQAMSYSAVPRSFKLDDNSISNIGLISDACAASVPGTFLAPGSWYVSPAAVRRDWEAPGGSPAVVVLLGREFHEGPARIEPMSTGAAAIEVVEALIGGHRPAGRADLADRVLASLRNTMGFRARGADPTGIARVLQVALA